MTDLLCMTGGQMVHLRAFFPESHDRPRDDDRRALSGIISLNRDGLRWWDAPRADGPAKDPPHFLDALER